MTSGLFVTLDGGPLLLQANEIRVNILTRYVEAIVEEMIVVCFDV